MRVAATGAVTQYTYDALARVLTETYPSDRAENVSYRYDQSGHGYGIGRLTSISDAAGSLSRSYDQLGNLLTDVRTTGTTILTTAYTYDTANRITSISYPSGSLVSYTRDTMGRITAVTAKPSGGTSTPVVSGITYKPFGPYAGLTYGNAVAETRGFDQDYRLTGITDTGTSALQNLSYTYHATNNVKTIANAMNAGNSQSFSYDNLQRLNQAAGEYGAFGFIYDKDGNRLTQALGIVTTHYGYNPASDLLTNESVGGTVTQTIGYTADGRIGSLSPGIQAPGGQYITSLSYNQDARLSAVNASSGALASYTYDGFGQRLIKSISSTYGEIYQYAQDGMLLEETDASGVAQADYIYLNGRPVTALNGSTLYYLHDDLLGTPQLATDSSQAVAWQATYDPFGQASVSGTITQNLRLPGQYFDVESDWNHNGFRDYAPTLGRYIEPDPLGMQGSTRFYNPATGRFLSEDPIGFQGGINKYTYAGNNPTNFVDPSGLLTVYIWNYTGSTAGENWGHASMMLNDGTYISWWPNCASGGGGSPFTNVPAYQQRDPRDDIRDEGSLPNESIPIEGLDEAAIKAWWDKYRKSDPNWKTIGRNCSTTVADGLKAGGAPDTGQSSSHLVWTPADVLQYALDIAAGKSWDDGLGNMPPRP